MIKESELELKFKEEFLDLIQDEKRQNKLSKKILKMARPHATDDIVKKIIDLMT